MVNGGSGLFKKNSFISGSNWKPLRGLPQPFGGVICYSLLEVPQLFPWSLICLVTGIPIFGLLELLIFNSVCQIVSTQSVFLESYNCSTMALLVVAPFRLDHNNPITKVSGSVLEYHH